MRKNGRSLTKPILSLLFPAANVVLSPFCQQIFPISYVCTIRVARWFVYKPKTQIWVIFGGSCKGRCWYILWTLGPFFGLLLYFMDIWYSLWKIGIFIPVLVFCTKKNLATLCTIGPCRQSNHRKLHTTKCQKILKYIT
jgi:hypothetical protein